MTVPSAMVMVEPLASDTCTVGVVEGVLAGFTEGDAEALGDAGCVGLVRTTGVAVGVGLAVAVTVTLGCEVAGGLNEKAGVGDEGM